MKAKMSIALLSLLIAAGCSENDQVSLPQVPENAVPINIGQRVDAVTRGVAESGVEVTATILRCDGTDINDWSGFTKVDKNVINESSQLTTRASISAASFVVGTTTNVSLNQALYYHTDNSTESFIAAVSPAGEVANTGTMVSFSEKDGTQDVMHAPAISVGKATDVDDAHELTFSHKTTQLNFAVKLQKVEGGGEWNNKRVTLKSITVLDASVPQSVDVSTGSVGWTEPVAMNVPKISDLALNESATDAGSPFMIKADNSVMLNVTISVDGNSIHFNKVPVTKEDTTNDLATTEGKSHKVTLTIKEPSTAADAVVIKTTATVTPWVEGDSGNAEL